MNNWNMSSCKINISIGIRSWSIDLIFAKPTTMCYISSVLELIFKKEHIGIYDTCLYKSSYINSLNHCQLSIDGDLGKKMQLYYLQPCVWHIPGLVQYRYMLASSYQDGCTLQYLPSRTEFVYIKFNILITLDYKITRDAT